MRFALRNQHKIKKHFEPQGEQVLSRIIDSLTTYFAKHTEIDAEIEKVPNEPYPMLLIPDTGHTCNSIMFYVISKTYDVYKLAFKEFVG